MMKLTPCVALAASALALTGAIAGAQAIPADTGTPTPGVGFSLPRVGGTLSYALSASELISIGFYNNSGVASTTDFSGDLAYVSRSQDHPFSAVYSGGVLFGNDNQPTTTFQNLSFSQVLNTKHWNITVGDTVSYLPESPAVGLSGIPGVGDLGVDPISTVIGETPGLGILTTYGPRVSNSASGSVSRLVTGRISIQGSGNYSIQRFIGDNAGLGIDTTSEGGSLGLNYRLSARDAFAGSYNYTNFSISGTPGSFSTQGATFSYSRQWSPRLSSSVYAGPQISTGNDSPLYSGGSYTSLAAGAGVSYLTPKTSYTLSYSRGVNNGSGVVAGALTDSVSLAAHRRFGRVWAVSGDVSYARNTTLPIFDLYTFDSNGVAFSGQATRGFGRYFSAYASYTLEDQSTSGSGIGINTPNAFSGLYQVVGLGVTFSPRNILLNK